MIGIVRENIKNIPCLIVAEKTKVNDALPILTYFHGFMSAKEHNLPLAYMLAERGFRVILPDSAYHGERSEEISKEKLQLSFWDIVIKNVEELGDIEKFLQEKNLLLKGRFGVAGTSMGGITTSALLTKYPWIKVAAILMGTPKITLFAQCLLNKYFPNEELPIHNRQLEDTLQRLENIDISKQTAKLNNRPLLFWHGENDQVVPIDHSYTFYDEVKELYENRRNIQFIKEENRDHKVSRYAILKTVHWFEQHL